MFEQGMIGRTHRAWTVPAGFALQLLLVGAAVIAPLAIVTPLTRTDVLPPFIAPPMGRPAQPEHVKLVPVNNHPQRALRPFTAPAAIPDRIARIVDNQPPVEVARAGYNCEPNCVVGAPVYDGPPVMSQRPPYIPPTPVAARPPDPQRPARVDTTPVVIRVSEGVQEMRILRRVLPVYPSLAVKMRVTGDVVLNAVIGTDGRIRELRVISGHPLLVKAAVDAVEQWVYRPAELNHVPVEVNTEVTVRFRLQ